MNTEIRQLQEQDWEIWKGIRLEAVQLHPEAFGSSYEEESLWKDEDFKNSLIKSDIFGAFEEKKLIGIAGFFQFKLLKLKHRGNLFSMYVKLQINL